MLSEDAIHLHEQQVGPTVMMQIDHVNQAEPQPFHVSKYFKHRLSFPRLIPHERNLHENGIDAISNKRFTSLQHLQLMSLDIDLHDVAASRQLRCQVVQSPQPDSLRFTLPNVGIQVLMKRSLRVDGVGAMETGEINLGFRIHIGKRKRIQLCAIPEGCQSAAERLERRGNGLEAVHLAAGIRSQARLGDSTDVGPDIEDDSRIEAVGNRGEWMATMATKRNPLQKLLGHRRHEFLPWKPEPEELHTAYVVSMQGTSDLATSAI